MSKATMRGYTLPRISPKNPTKKDIKTPWYVWFRFLDPLQKKWIPVKKRGGINYFNDFKERLAEANSLKSEIDSLLKSGWNPLLSPEEQSKKPKDNPYCEKDTAILLEEFYLLKTSGLRKGSKKNYKVAKNYFITWLKETGRADLMPDQLTSQLAFSFLDWFVMKGFGNTTYNNYKEALKFLFNMFTARKIILDNPFKGVKDKPAAPQVNKPFTPSELKKIWDHLKEADVYLYRFSLLIYYCYIRPIEITRIQIKEVDLVKGVIFIPGDKAKNKRDGRVKMPPRLREEMTKMELDKYSGDHYLFGRRRFFKINKISIQPLWEYRTTITDAFTAVFNLLKITDRNLYSFKHTGVVAAYNAGVKIKAIKEQLRHQSLEETDIYLRSLGIDVNDEYLEVDY